MPSNVPSIFAVLLYAVLPVAAATVGGTIAAVKPPGPKLRSILQHFAAGVVFSVVAVELLPDVVKRHLPWEVALGFGAGVGLMLALKKMTGTAKSSVGLIVGMGADFFLDGLLIGIGFSAGMKEGKLLVFALTIELGSLGIALASTLIKSNWTRGRAVLMVTGLSLLSLMAAGLGATLLRSASSEVMEIILAFGLAALLFLVTEELLVEAHEEPETPMGTAMFFAGFLLFLIMGMVSLNKEGMEVMETEKVIEKAKPEHVQAVHACHQASLETLRHCLARGGDHLQPKHLTLLMDCEGICHLHEDFLLRGSHHHHAICKACEEICEECARSCDSFKGDQSMTACAQACRRCAEVCRMM